MTTTGISNKEIQIAAHCEEGGGEERTFRIRRPTRKEEKCFEIHSLVLLFR